MKIDSDPNTAFFEASRRRLTSIAYRMLGDLAEAQDVVQEAWLRWNRSEREDLNTPAAWLTTVVTRLSIDRLRRNRHRLPLADVSDAPVRLPDPWMESHAPSPEDALSNWSDLSYGTMLLMRQLGPEERAALLLHEVFDCSYDEISKIVNKTPVHCRQLVSRARKRMRSARRLPYRTNTVSEEIVRDLLEAVRCQDRQAMLRLVAPEATIMIDRGNNTVEASAGIVGVSSLLTLLPHSEPESLVCRPLCINDGWGLVVLYKGRIVLSAALEGDSTKIGAVYAMAAPIRLGVLARSGNAFLWGTATRSSSKNAKKASPPYMPITPAAVTVDAVVVESE